MGNALCRCDEIKSEETKGACKRCFSGSWECKWPLPPGERPLKSFKGSKQRGNTARGESSVAESGQEEEDGNRGREGSSRGERRGASNGANGDGQAAFEPPSVYNPQIPYPPSTSYSLPYPTPNSHYSQPIPPLQPLPPPVTLPTLPNQQNTDLNDFFASLDAELGYWQTMGEETHNSGVSAEFTTMPMPGDPDAELPMQAQPTPSEPFQLPAPPPFDDETPAEESSQPVETDDPISSSLHQPVASTSAQMIEDQPPPPAQHTDPTSNSSSSPPDEPDIVDPVYNSFNEGFFRSLPKPVRDIVVKRIYGLANSHELSRNASMAMVMLYRLRMQSSSEENPDAAASTDAQARLLAQSDVYFQRAMEHLQKPIPFEAKLVATLDMQAYQVSHRLLVLPCQSIYVLLAHSSINSAPLLQTRFFS